MPREPALLTSAGRMPERSQHRVSEGQDARSERPATGCGHPLPTQGAALRTRRVSADSGGQPSPTSPRLISSSDISPAAWALP